MFLRTVATESKPEVNAQAFLQSLSIESIKSCSNVELLADVLIAKLKEITAPTFNELAFQKKMSQNPYRAPELDSKLVDIDMRIQAANAKFDNTVEALNEIKKNKFVTSAQAETLNGYKKEFSGRTACLFEHLLSLVPQKQVFDFGFRRV